MAEEQTESRAKLEVPYLRSCNKECDEPVVGEVKGEIPPWLRGSLVRIGCGLLEIGPDKYNHVFDGLALLHNFSVQDGRVTYKNRFLRSDTYRKNMKANRIVVSEFGTRGQPDPCKTIFRRLATLFSLDDFTDNDLVNIVPYSDEFFACSETNYIWKIDPKTLESVKKVNLSKFVTVNAATAHPHIDVDGTVYNIGSSFGSKGGYVIVKFLPKKDKASSPFEEGSIVCKIPAAHRFSPSYFHSFGITTNYFVFVEQPLEMSVPRLMWAHFTWQAYADSMKWHPQQKSRFHVVRREDGALLPSIYVAHPFMVFHHINAYEEDDHLVVDLCCFDNGEVVKSLYVSALEEMYSNPKKTADLMNSSACRFVLPLIVAGKNKVSSENLVQLKDTEATAVRQSDGTIMCQPEILTGNVSCGAELPRINYEHCNGRKYRYFYAIAKKNSMRWSHLVKVDTELKSTLFWGEDGTIPSEPVFVARPEASEEDDGVLLSSLLSTTDDRQVTLLILDARSMTEIGRATFAAPGTVPADFHGLFVRDN